MNKSYSKIIEVITTPLGFFALALFIVEGFLATVLIASEFEKNEKIFGMSIGVVLFLIVLIAVFVLVWFKPQNLTFDKSAHLIDRGKAPFGTDSYLVLNRDELKPTEAKNDE
ncbi:hypothetical protein KJ039_08985 [bacterium]|nr:hypothetical protein [bacterium]